MDSENICTGQGYLVLQAAKWAADGLPPKNISMRLQGLAKRVELSFVLNQLDYMAKSGRCSGVLAFGANILGIKPSLAVIDGELKVVRKYRGSLPICVGKYITDQLANREDIDRSMVFIFPQDRGSPWKNRTGTGGSFGADGAQNIRRAFQRDGHVAVLFS